ncbi:helix-turn-helix domain-containing protein [Streptomyces sp. ET3-23]|uniref:helix-turn-helix domain-containing protein n=1 Tax=Streptomyces sp. ET3-23 TaxID=2885643 RepID=UPI001D12D424|nr:helix-turn-helix domain-containing protein [Streptomyces sp. ET3-23]MCC2276191.1 helix-turn-helix domain-containing protein [Streptomyces sp. ET3-23]
MTAVEVFAHQLRQIHAAAGAPSTRQMAARTGYGKSTISEAFAGRRLPTWPVVEKLAAALGADADEARDQWVAARGRPTSVQTVPDWLTSVRTDIPKIATRLSFEQACALAPTDAKQALAASWEVLRLSALQLAHCYYGDIPGSWSSNVVDTYRRAEKDGLLPAGVTAVANTVHYRHVESNLPSAELPSTAELLQTIVLAYRLAWQARDVIEVRAAASEPRP